MGTHGVARSTGDAQNVGQVQLALGVIGIQLRQAVAQNCSIEGEHARVDLGNCLLLLRRVLFLDDGGDHAVVGAQDAAVPGGVVLVDGQHGYARAIMGGGEFPQGIG